MFGEKKDGGEELGGGGKNDLSFSLSLLQMTKIHFKTMH